MPTTKPAPLTAIDHALLPLGGGMRQFVPWLTNALHRNVAPMVEWPDWSFYDMTAGTVSCSATLRFYRMKVVANDLALRTYTAARALFSGRGLQQTALTALLAKAGGSEPLVPEDKVTAEELAGRYLLPRACRVFDALYWAVERGDLPEADLPLVKYLGLRWVIMMRSYMYFVTLPTSDPDLLATQSTAWARIVADSRDPARPLVKLLQSLNEACRLMGNRAGETLATLGDCRRVIHELPKPEKLIVSINPPTMGNAFFAQSNKVLDSLLHNAVQELEESELPGDLWRSLIVDTMAACPSGTWLYSFCGDGALTWEEGLVTWDGIADMVDHTTFRWRDSDKRAGLALLRLR